MALDGNTIVPTMPVSPTGGGDFLGGLGGGGGLLLLFFLLIICGGNGFGDFAIFCLERNKLILFVFSITV